jgi:class 3 adenylate cyclase
MPRLELLASLSIDGEATFELLVKKLSEIPILLKEQELDLLPIMMLATDLLRHYRHEQQQVQLSFFLERLSKQKRSSSQLLLHVSSSADNPVSPPHLLQKLLEQYAPKIDDDIKDNLGGSLIAAPLRKRPDQSTLESIIGMLNMPTKERLMSDLQAEKQKARDVLHKIFPDSVVRQLEAGQSAIYDYYPSTTILFSDMVGFTSLSKGMDARELVTFIDDIFQRIDQLCIKHGVEKIKTIGDSYMAAAGVPNSCDDHAERVANLAFDIQELHRGLAVSNDSGQQLDARIGIHSGPVVAGVIGLNKFSFDLWGDTVNVASRMESTGIPGEIQISIATRELLPDRFISHIRGHVAMKGHSSIETFLLRGH